MRPTSKLAQRNKGDRSLPRKTAAKKSSSLHHQQTDRHNEEAESDENEFGLNNDDAAALSEPSIADSSDDGSSSEDDLSGQQADNERASVPLEELLRRGASGAEASPSGSDADDVPERYSHLVDVPFERLTQLRDSLGLKAFEKLLKGVNYRVDKQRQQGRRFVRESKKRPREASSKIRPPLRRVESGAVGARAQRRDPRFDDTSGDFNEKRFLDTYRFLGDVRQREIRALERRAKAEREPSQRAALRSTLQSLRQQRDNAERRQRQMEQHAEQRRAAEEAVQHGARPFFSSHAARRRQNLADHFTQLKQTGRFEKYLRKRSKRAASRPDSFA